MILNDLIEIAEDNGIEIAHIPCGRSGSMSLRTDEGDCYIGIDKEPATSAVELTRTAHELGHCMTGAFYNRYSRHNVVSKQEYTADKWAIQKLIPIDELKDARRSGATEAWELAERFGVTEDFIRRAVYIYKAMGEIE